METPSVIFYEHNFDDSIIKSLSKNVLNLGNECRALAQENARLRASSFVTAVPVEEYEELKAELTDCKAKADRLKDEVERLNNLIISGGAVTADAQIYVETN